MANGYEPYVVWDTIQSIEFTGYKLEVIKEQQKEIEAIKNQLDLGFNEEGNLTQEGEEVKVSFPYSEPPFIQKVKLSLEKLGLYLEEGIVRVRKVFTREEICIGDEGERVCLDKEELKALKKLLQERNSSEENNEIMEETTTFENPPETPETKELEETENSSESSETEGLEGVFDQENSLDLEKSE